MKMPPTPMLLAGGAGLILIGLLIYKSRRAIQNTYRMITRNYFTIAELTRSSTATAKGIDNTPTAAVRANLEALISNLLNPIREKYGNPIVVTSGYRCAALNKAVGGVADSQHLTGNAADLVGEHGTAEEVKAIFRAALSVGGYDQLIIEHKGATRWVHVSWSASRRRGQLLCYRNGTYTNITTANWQAYV